MRFFALLAGLLFSVPSLSPANIDRLISRYLADNQPEIYLFLNRPVGAPFYRALTRAGILQRVGSGSLNCSPTLPEYDLTPYGRRVAAVRDWTIDKAGDVLITLGSFSLVHSSISVTKRGYQPARAAFDYWFHPNANVPYLLSLAPSAVWGNVGMDVGHGLTLNQAGRLSLETFPVIFDDNGWVVDDYIHRPVVICN